MRQNKKCTRCDNDFYASYKGKYYCTYHLEQVLNEEKLKSNNNVNNER